MKTAIITGAARGIGLATVHKLIERGWSVAMVDIDATALKHAAHDLHHVTCFDTDISDPEQISILAKKVSQNWPHLTGLVNNAAHVHYGPFSRTDYADWRAVMRTNLDGPYLMTQAFVPLLKTAPNASVVNLTSISGLRASIYRLAYGTSKAALAHLTKQYAVELGEFGIRVNAVAPGPISTKLAMDVHTQEIIESYHDAIPLNRYGTVEEIANSINFLLSDEASYITGQILAVDGGFESTGIGLPNLRKTQERQ